MPRLGGGGVPLDGLGAVPFDVLAGRVGVTKIVLGVDVALLGPGAIRGQRVGVEDVPFHGVAVRRRRLGGFRRDAGVPQNQ